jgi:hypothetical protein
MNALDEGVGFEKQQSGRLRVAVDHRAIVARPGGGIWVPRDQRDETLDEGVLADITERFQSGASSGRL